MTNSRAGASGKWQAVALLFASGAINYADRTAITALFPLVRDDLGLSDVGLAMVGSLFLWSYALGSPFAGVLADRMARRRIVILSLAAWSLVTLATGFVADARQLFALRLLLGVSECFYLPAALGLLADFHGGETRATALSLHSAGLSLGMIAGGTVAGLMGDAVGWRMCFGALGAAGLALAVLVWLLLPTPPRSATTGPASEPLRTAVAAIARVATFRIILVEAALIAISNWVFANWLPLYFRESYDLTLARAGFAGTFALTAGVVTGGLAGGYLSDRLAHGDPRRRLLAQGLFYAAAAPWLLVFLTRPAIAILGVSIFVFGVLRALGSSNELPVLCDSLPPHRRATAIGFMNAMNTLIGGAGVLLSGYLKGHFGLDQVFLGLGGAVGLASAACLAGYCWTVPKGASHV